MRCLFLIITLVTALLAGQTIAKDSVGLVVMVREKYGPALVDTCTVVTLHENNFVLTHRDGRTGWYPVGNYSVNIIERMGNNEQPAEK